MKHGVYAPSLCKLTLELLTFKAVFESHCSRLTPDAHDRQTDVRRVSLHLLNAHTLGQGPRSHGVQGVN